MSSPPALLTDRLRRQIERRAHIGLTRELNLLTNAMHSRVTCSAKRAPRPPRLDENGNINTTNNPTYAAPVSVNYTYVMLIDPKTVDSLWSDSKRWATCIRAFTRDKRTD